MRDLQPKYHSRNRISSWNGQRRLFGRDVIDENEEKRSMVYWNICPIDNVRLYYSHKKQLISQHHFAKRQY